MDNEFIKHIKCREPKTEYMGDAVSYISKLYVSVMENTEKVLEDAIIAMCKAEGITDIYLLNKNAILSALRKQIKEKRSIRIGIRRYCDDRIELVCPCCGSGVDEKQNYCSECGQALEEYSSIYELGKWGGADV